MSRAFGAKRQLPIAKPAAPIAKFVSTANDYPGSCAPANDLRDDIERVTGRAPPNAQSKAAPERFLLSALSAKVRSSTSSARESKIDFTSISGKWESFLTKWFRATLAESTKPSSLREAIACTIYGIYELSDQMEYPLVLWPTFPTSSPEALYVKPGVLHSGGPPGVKYRGIF